MRLMQSKLAKKNLSPSRKENSCFASICREVFGAKFVSSTWCKYTLPHRASLLGLQFDVLDEVFYFFHGIFCFCWFPKCCVIVLLGFYCLWLMYEVVYCSF